MFNMGNFDVGNLLNRRLVGESMCGEEFKAFDLSTFAFKCLNTTRYIRIIEVHYLLSCLSLNEHYFW